MPRCFYSLAFASIILATSSCSTNIGGQLNDVKTDNASRDAAFYNVPQYSIGLMQFENKIPSKMSEAGNPAISIMASKLEAAGLRTTLLNTKDQDASTWVMPTQTSSTVTGNKSLSGNELYSFDFRLTGAVTGYSEVEEGIDTIVFQQKTSVSRISIEYALVDITSGKSILAESSTGEYRKVGSSKTSKGSTVDTTLLDGALNEALGKATEKIIQKLRTIPFQGRILDVANQSVILKAGTRSSLVIGSQLDVYHIGEAILDLGSGKIIGYLENKVGVIEIRSHRNDSHSEAIIITGNSIQTGDVVRRAP